MTKHREKLALQGRTQHRLIGLHPNQREPLQAGLLVGPQGWPWRDPTDLGPTLGPAWHLACPSGRDEAPIPTCPDSTPSAPTRLAPAWAQQFRSMHWLWNWTQGRSTWILHLYPGGKPPQCLLHCWDSAISADWLKSLQFLPTPPGQGPPE